jgi:hypothetical protein
MEDCDSTDEQIREQFRSDLEASRDFPNSPPRIIEEKVDYLLREKLHDVERWRQTDAAINVTNLRLVFISRLLIYGGIVVVILFGWLTSLLVRKA